jgi:hypothetical protein
VRICTLVAALSLLSTASAAEPSAGGAAILVLRGAHASQDTPLSLASLLADGTRGNSIEVLRGSMASLVTPSQPSRAERPLALVDPPLPPPPKREEPPPPAVIPLVYERVETESYGVYDDRYDGSTGWALYGLPLRSHRQPRWHQRAEHDHGRKRHGSSIRLGGEFRPAFHPSIHGGRHAKPGRGQSGRGSWMRARH